MKTRIKFSKRGNLRFVGHLDLMRFFQKANRRAGLPVSYSEGFSPHQIMSFAAPLGMGLESTAEYFDLRFQDEAAETLSSDSVRERLNAQMAEGLEILEVRRLPDDAGNCMSAVSAADYEIRFENAPEGFQERLAGACLALLAAESVPVIKEGKKGPREVDLKPMIHSLSAEGGCLFMKVAQGSEANLKPELLLGAMDQMVPELKLSGLRRRILRTELYGRDGLPLSAEGDLF